ncbi:MAG: serine/threonine protein kinase [Pirellulales bacterium]|nr:serine/threonine protein kinase [Pirellulales bacterium]
MNESAGERPPEANEQRPNDVPDFELIRPIGEGGFGRVWMARNRTTGRLRAIKLIAKSRMGTADPAGREMASIARLEANLRHQHPNLLTIHHVGQTADHLFYVMDLADDGNGMAEIEPDDYEPATLRARLDNGPMTPDDALCHARELLAGLASLHESGMVHRDVKPANCLFIHGQLRLADFGLLTRTGLNVSRIGTEKYMPPDGRMDTRADVYAAGLVIYEMITGYSADRFPQLGDRSAAVLDDPTLSALMGLALDACEPASDRNRASRFSEAGQMLRALDRRLDEPPCPAKPRRLLVAGLLGVVAAALVVGAAFWFFHVPRVSVNFITYPTFDATILLDGRPLKAADGKTLLVTPCTVDQLPGRVHHVVFQHPNEGDLDYGQVDFRTTRQVVGRWKTVNQPFDE